MASNPNDHPAQARAEARLFKSQEREAQASKRESAELARVAALDEKTARLKAPHLAKDAE